MDRSQRAGPRDQPPLGGRRIGAEEKICQRREVAEVLENDEPQV
jgi:hypothetical protein